MVLMAETRTAILTVDDDPEVSRAIARDLGEMLNTGGYLTELRRTRIGAFVIADAVTLEQLQSDGVKPHLRPISLADVEHSEQRGQNDQHQG